MKSAARALISLLFTSEYGTQIKIFGAIQEGDFEHDIARRIFAACKESHLAGKEISPYAVANKIGDKNIIASIIGSTTCYVSNVDTIIEDVRREGAAIRLKRVLRSVMKETDPYKAIKELSESVSEIQDRTMVLAKNPRRLREELGKEIEVNRGKGYVGYSTPYPGLNERTSGMRRKHFWVIGGYTSAGKTLVACEITHHMIHYHGQRVLWFSTEMDASSIMLRLAARASGVPTSRILMGDVCEEEWRLIDMTYEECNGLLTLYDDVYNVDDMRIKAITDKAHNEGELALIVVDFVQNVLGAKNAGIYERVSDASIRLQKLAKELDVVVLCTSQLSNEAMRDGGGGVIGYKGAGELAAAPDVGVMLTHRRKEDVIILDVRKNRHGPLGSERLRFTSHFTRLEPAPSVREVNVPSDSARYGEKE